jgi:plastocyanin
VIAAALAAATLAAAPSGTAVGIGLSEWEVALYRPQVPVGKVRFNITNLGEDGHDFAVRNRAGRVLLKVPELPSGGQTTARFRFRSKGRYVLYCALEGHEDAGMKARLRVVRPSR